MIAQSSNDGSGGRLVKANYEFRDSSCVLAESVFGRIWKNKQTMRVMFALQIRPTHNPIRPNRMYRSSGHSMDR